MPEKNDANKLVADKRTAASPGKVAVKKVSAEKSPAVSPGNVAVKRMSAENASPAPPGKAENRKLSSGITPIEKEAVAKNLPFFAIPTDPIKGDELATDRVCYGALQRERIDFSHSEMQWTGEEETQILKVTNMTPNKLAFKMKCSDNSIFGISPVFGTLDVYQVLDIKIRRKAAPPKHDKVVFCAAKYDPAEKDLEAFFKKISTPIQETYIAQIPAPHPPTSTAQGRANKTEASLIPC